VTSLLQGDGLGLCDIVGFVLGGSAGLSRDLACESAMSADSGCADKTFLDQETDCANLICGTCGNGAASQNAHDNMLAGLGRNQSNTILTAGPNSSEVVTFEF